MKAIFILLIFTLCSVPNQKQGQVIILNKSSKLFHDRQCQKENQNTRLKFLEEVTISERSEKVVGIKKGVTLIGWTNSENTSLIPESWGYYNMHVLKLRVPPESKFNFIEADSINEKDEKTKEYKLFNDDYFIQVERLNSNIESYIQKNPPEEILFTSPKVNLKYNSLLFNGKKYFYFTSIDVMDGRKFHKIVFEGNDNEVISIIITLNKKSYSEFFEMDALKILFSAEPRKNKF